MNLSNLPLPLQTAIGKLLQTYPVNLPGGNVFEPNLLQAILMVFMIFLLIITLGHLRHTYVDWSIKGVMPGLTFGFAIAIILEGLLLIGGKTFFTEILAWKNPPKPISNMLDSSREKLVDVLGVSKEIPSSNAKELKTAASLKTEYGNLSDDEKAKFMSLLCKPK